MQVWGCSRARDIFETLGPSSKKTTCSFSYRFRGRSGNSALYQGLRVARVVSTWGVCTFAWQTSLAQCCYCKARVSALPHRFATKTCCKRPIKKLPVTTHEKLLGQGTKGDVPQNVLTLILLCLESPDWRVQQNLSLPIGAHLKVRSGGSFSETGRIRFRGARLQTPNSVSVFGPHRVLGRELSEFLLAYDLCVKGNSPSFSQNSPSLPQNSVKLSEFSSPKQYSRISIPPVS